MLAHDAGRVITIRPSAAARRRAEREALSLAAEIDEELAALRAGDWGAAFSVHQLAGRLAVGVVMHHALDADGPSPRPPDGDGERWPERQRRSA